MMPGVWIRTGEGERKRKKIERKYGFQGLVQEKKNERERKEIEKRKKKKQKRKSNRLQPVSFLHPTAQIFSNFLRISNGLKALAGPSIHSLQTGPKSFPLRLRKGQPSEKAPEWRESERTSLDFIDFELFSQRTQIHFCFMSLSQSSKIIPQKPCAYHQFPSNAYTLHI